MTNQATSDASRQRGFALLIVLWVVASASLLVLSFNVAARSGASMASAGIELGRIEAALDAGTEIAATRLIDTDEGQRWMADGEPHKVSFGGAELTIRIGNPNGLIDLNKADEKLLLGLFRQFTSEGLAAALTERIVSARGTSPAAGQRNAMQASSTAMQGPAFIDVAQLRYVSGMTLKLYHALQPFLTVYSRDGRIHAGSAPDAVLLAIPEMTTADVTRLRDAARSAQGEMHATTQAIARAQTYLQDEAGPAYVVSVEAKRQDGTYRSAQTAVIVTGLNDETAPYRLIAKRTVALADEGGERDG